MREPIHPGETLPEDLDALGMSSGVGAADRGAGQLYHGDSQR